MPISVIYAPLTSFPACIHFCPSLSGHYTLEVPSDRRILVGEWHVFISACHNCQQSVLSCPLIPHTNGCCCITRFFVHEIPRVPCGPSCNTCEGFLLNSVIYRRLGLLCRSCRHLAVLIVYRCFSVLETSVLSCLETRSSMVGTEFFDWWNKFPCFFVLLRCIFLNRVVS